MAFRRVVMSGIQPSGVPHLGNYFGALRSWVDLQRKEEAQVPILTMVADLHSITTRLRRESWEESLEQQVLQSTAALLAVGVDPARSVLFKQSAIKEHLELAWLCNSFVSIAFLQKMGQYKAKAAEAGAAAPLGLLAYPVLMAADVLLYKATAVPVGEDQLQHFSIIKKVVQNANRLLGTGHPDEPPLFPEPRWILSSTPRLMSLRKADAKMSKSDSDPLATILLSDSHHLIRSKLKKALTDFTSKVEFDPQNRPAVANLVRLHSLVTGRSEAELVEEAGMETTAEYKLRLAEDVEAFVRPMRERYEEAISRPDHLRRILEEGTLTARAMAEETMAEIRQRLHRSLSHSIPSTQSASALPPQSTA